MRERIAASVHGRYGFSMRASGSRSRCCLLHARATDRLRLASVETIDRGIFVNDAETVAFMAERRDARCPALAGREPRVHAVRSGVGP